MMPKQNFFTLESHSYTYVPLFFKGLKHNSYEKKLTSITE